MSEKVTFILFFFLLPSRLFTAALQPLSAGLRGDTEAQK